MSDADTCIKVDSSSKLQPVSALGHLSNHNTLWTITAISSSCKSLDELHDCNMGSAINDLIRKAK